MHLTLEFEVQQPGLQLRGVQAAAGDQGVQAAGFVAEQGQQTGVRAGVRPGAGLGARRGAFGGPPTGRVERQRHLGERVGLAQLFEHILCAFHQLGALSDQGVAALALRRVDRAGDGEHLAPLFQRLPCRDQRA